MSLFLVPLSSLTFEEYQSWYLTRGSPSGWVDDWWNNSRTTLNLQLGDVCLIYNVRKAGGRGIVGLARVTIEGHPVKASERSPGTFAFQLRFAYQPTNRLLKSPISCTRVEELANRPKPGARVKAHLTNVENPTRIDQHHALLDEIERVTKVPFGRQVPAMSPAPTATPGQMISSFGEASVGCLVRKQFAAGAQTGEVLAVGKFALKVRFGNETLRVMDHEVLA